MTRMRWPSRRSFVLDDELIAGVQAGGDCDPAVDLRRRRARSSCASATLRPRSTTQVDRFVVRGDGSGSRGRRRSAIRPSGSWTTTSHRRRGCSDEAHAREHLRLELRRRIRDRDLHLQRVLLDVRLVDDARDPAVERPVRQHADDDLRRLIDADLRGVGRAGCPRAPGASSGRTGARPARSARRRRRT